MKFSSLIAVFSLFLSLAGCASQPAQEQAENATPTAKPKEVDPFEKFNRATFSFNDYLDTWVVKPTAKGYRYITPDAMEQGVSNFFSNLNEVSNTINNALQWKWKKAANDGGRFLINSTFGIGGLFEVAQYAGLPKNDPESFGQTFSYWGVPQGPYLVLPFLGSSTVTDAVGLPIWWELHPVSYIEDSGARVGLTVLGAVDLRAKLLDAEDLISGDKYLFIRDAYLQRRAYLVRDGAPDLEGLEGLDDFGDDFDDLDGDF